MLKVSRLLETDFVTGFWQLSGANPGNITDWLPDWGPKKGGSKKCLTRISQVLLKLFVCNRE